MSYNADHDLCDGVRRNRAEYIAAAQFVPIGVLTGTPTGLMGPEPGNRGTGAEGSRQEVGRFFGRGQWSRAAESELLTCAETGRQ